MPNVAGEARRCARRELQRERRKRREERRAQRRNDRGGRRTTSDLNCADGTYPVQRQSGAPHLSGELKCAPIVCPHTSQRESGLAAVAVFVFTGPLLRLDLFGTAEGTIGPTSG
jgi:hypothetical protein